MKKNYLLNFLAVWLFGSVSFVAQGQSCNCDHLISPSLSPAIWGNNSRNPVRPGQTICIMAGTYKFMRFYNLQGTAEQPITIKNCGGQVVIDSDTLPSGNTSGMMFNNCKHIRFTGTGDAQYEYGVQVRKTVSGAGVGLASLSTNCEVDHLDISGCAFSGIMAKTDPGCDSTSWRDYFTMYDVKLHHNYIHDLIGEGIYAGNTSWDDGMRRTCNGQTRVVYPHRILGLHIYNNRIERTGSEGIQTACAPDGRVHDNLLISCGVSPFDVWQNNGMQIGGGSGGLVYNNTILNTAGVGLIVGGFVTDVSVFNNLIVNTGADAIFSDRRASTPPNTNLYFVNNTIVNGGRDAIRLYSQITNHFLYNNALINPKSGRYVVPLSLDVRIVSRNNFQGSVAAAEFADPLNGDYRLSGTSPLRDAGIGVDSVGLTVDLENLPRQQGSAVDIGAYEYLAGAALRMRATQSSTPITATGNQVRTFETGKVRITTFPNPARADVTCRVSVGTIQELTLLNAQSKSMLQRKYHAPQGAVRFNVATLASGVYLLRVRTETGWHTTRLVRR